MGSHAHSLLEGSVNTRWARVTGLPWCPEHAQALGAGPLGEVQAPCTFGWHVLILMVLLPPPPLLFCGDHILPIHRAMVRITRYSMELI